MPLQIRRGTEAERQSMTAPLAAGEPLYVTDDKRLYIGDSSTPGGIAVTGYTDEDAVDAVGAALVAGEHQNVTFVYGQDQDVANRIDANIDLSTYNGAISATSFQGNIIDSDNVILINSLTSTINLNGTVKGNVIPDQNETYDLGSVSNKFRDLYLSGSSLWLGNAQLTSSDTTLNLPAGSTIGGISIIVPGGDLNINIIDDSSTVLVNILTGVITAPGGFIGDVTGSMFSNDLTMIIDGNSGEVTGPINNDSITTDQLIFRGPLSGIRLATEGTTNDDYDLLTVESYHNENEESSAMFYIRGRGSIDSPSPVVAGDTILQHVFAGIDLQGESVPSVIIQAGVDGNGTISNNIIPGEISIITFNNSGVPVVGLNIDRDGSLTIADNTVDPDTVNVAGGAVKYLKIKIGSVEYAMPLFNLN